MQHSFTINRHQPFPLLHLSVIERRLRFIHRAIAADGRPGEDT